MHLAATPFALPPPPPPLPLYKYCQLFGIFIIAQTFMVVDGAGIAQGVAEEEEGEGGGMALTATISGFNCSSSRVPVCVCVCGKPLET